MRTWIPDHYTLPLYLTLGWLPVAGMATPAEAQEGWTLDRAVEAALTRSPTTDRMDATLRSAEAQRWATLARALPSATVSASYLRNDEEITLDPTGGATLPPGAEAEEILILPLEQQSAKLSVTVPLFDPQAWLAVRQSWRGTAATEADLADARALFHLAVASAYLDAAVADARLTVAQKTEAADALRLERARARHAEGKERNSTLLRMEADRLGSAQQTVQAAGLARAAREVLSIYVGEPVEGALAPVPVPDTAPSLSADEASAAADAHPTVIAADARVAVASASRTASISAFLPRVDGAFTYSYQDPAGGLSNPDGEQWTASVTGTWVVFGSGAKIANTRGAVAQVEAARASAAEAREAVRRELARQHAAAEAAVLSVGVARARLDAAERAAAETRADYEEGLVLLLDAEAADAALAQARAALVEAEATAARATLSLDRALGRL